MGGKKEYHEQFYDHKLDNLGEMEQFLELTHAKHTRRNRQSE